MAIVAVGAPASGLDVFLRFQGVLTDPIAGPDYIIREPAGTVIGSGTGHRRSVGHYDARDTTIPSGFSTTAAWSVTWTATSPAGVTNSVTEEFTVADSLEMAFSSLANITDLVKLDLSLTTDDFTQAQLDEFVQKAVNRINRRLRLTGTAAEIVFDEGSGTISPTPNATILDFLVMQVECFIVQNIRKIAVGKGIRVKDGETEIDTTASFKGFDDQVKDICNELKDAVEDFLEEEDRETYINAVVDGASVVWYGNSNICEDLLHNNQGDGRTRCIVSPFETHMGLHFNW